MSNVIELEGVLIVWWWIFFNKELEDLPAIGCVEYDEEMSSGTV